MTDMEQQPQEHQSDDFAGSSLASWTEQLKRTLLLCLALISIAAAVRFGTGYLPSVGWRMLVGSVCLLLFALPLLNGMGDRALTDFDAASRSLFVILTFTFSIALLAFDLRYPVVIATSVIVATTEEYLFRVRLHNSLLRLWTGTRLGSDLAGKYPRYLWVSVTILTSMTFAVAHFRSITQSANLFAIAVCLSCLVQCAGFRTACVAHALSNVNVITRGSLSLSPWQAVALAAGAVFVTLLLTRERNDLVQPNTDGRAILVRLDGPHAGFTRIGDFLRIALVLGAFGIVGGRAIDLTLWLMVLTLVAVFRYAGAAQRQQGIVVKDDEDTAENSTPIDAPAAPSQA
jgi:hypothetical protein